MTREKHRISTKNTISIVKMLSYLNMYDLFEKMATLEFKKTYSKTSFKLILLNGF